MNPPQTSASSATSYILNLTTALSSPPADPTEAANLNAKGGEMLCALKLSKDLVGTFASKLPPAAEEVEEEEAYDLMAALEQLDETAMPETGPVRNNEAGPSTAHQQQQPSGPALSEAEPPSKGRTAQP